MAKRGNNIYKHKDDRFENRVSVGFNENGKLKSHIKLNLFDIVF